MKLISFGEVLWDVYPEEKFIGGAPFNFAAHFSRCGGEAFMLSCVGKDTLGEETLAAVKAQGVSTDYIFISEDRETGKCLVTLNEKGIPSYNLLSDTAYDNIKVKDDFSINDFGVLYFGTLALRSKNNFDLMKKLADEFNGEVLVDINIRAPHYSAQTVEFGLNNATIVKISDEELPTVTSLVLGEQICSPELAADRLKEKFKKLKLIIITLGEKGSMVLNTKENKLYYEKAQKVTVASTVGAGDSFAATFLYEYLKGSSIDTCLKNASRVSGFVVSQNGAVPEYDYNELIK